MKKRILFFVLLIAMVMSVVSCINNQEEIELEIDDVEVINETEKQESSDASVEVIEQPLYNTEFSKPLIFGAQRAIIKGEVIPQQNDVQIKEIAAFLVNEKELEATYIDIQDNKIYAVFDGLNPDTEYGLFIHIEDVDKTVVLENQLMFATPKKTVDDIEKHIDNVLSNQIIIQENRLLLETQACMSLLGLDIDELGTYGFLTQANIIRLEYTFNSYDSFVDYSHIFGEPSQYLLDVLKSMLSISDENQNMIREFEVKPHAMTDYAKLVLCEKNYEEFCGDCENFCGKIDIDKYIYELAKQNQDAYETYVDLPFIIETQEFEDKYKDKNISKKLKEMEAAKNKAIFSMYQSKWMKNIAVNNEKIIPVAGADDDSLALSTMIALSYMTIDSYKETGKVFMVRSGYRDYNLQEKIHYKVMQKSEINYWRDLTWYKNRQKVSAVPGFSNHQYGYAIDFEGKYDYGIASFTKYSPELYSFLLKNGPSYGFYRNSSEPWHWAYLGKTFDDADIS